MAASAVISRVQRAAVGPIDDGLDKLHPDGWLRQRLGQLVGGLYPPIADPSGRRQGLELESHRRAEESLEGAHVSRQSLLQGGENTATVIVGHYDPEIRPRLFSPDYQAGRVVQRSQITE